MAYYDILNVVLSPLLELPAPVAVILMSLTISLAVILATKYLTNQHEMKRLKEDMKSHQQQMKEHRHNPSKAMELQKMAMQANLEYMKHSLKPTLITFIPIILIFGWMSANFAYESIKPQQQFTVTAFFDENAQGQATATAEGLSFVGARAQKIENGKATWMLKGDDGEYILEVEYDGEKQQKDILITQTKKYIEPAKKINGQVKSIQINYKKLTVIPIGYKDWLGWLGTYLLSSILFTLTLRKFLKVY